MPKAVYIHVPFCEQICHYCDFNKFFLQNQPVDEYIELCEMEIKNTISNFPTEEVSSVYVGGGTPTSLTTDQLGRLLEWVKEYFPLAENYEWSVEVNPGSANFDKLQKMQEIGVNRLSIGAQTFDAALLKKIGRDHEPGDVEKTVQQAIEAGFTNLSIDLMMGLPEQTMEQFQETLRQVVALPIQHISAYSLKIEPKTVFYQLWSKGKLPMPGDELEADMYEELRNTLKEAGFTHYEISNFAKKGFESTHNLTYWNNEEYYGIGAGAHSYVQGVRRINHGPLPKYMNAVKQSGFPYREEHQVSKTEAMEEHMFMGLRKLDGVSYTNFYNRFGIEMRSIFSQEIDRLVNDGLLRDNGSSIQLTDHGLLLGNEVFEKFLLKEQ
ncbi:MULTISPECIES: radical SAM family heme chaperone HemW [Bacillaceae]|uniref:Heme chaperone HemW n=1 Tax=Evansella alkalicola TaxID=745819 RepID=A0ABS6JVA4_9BACI|nr:MULTISPECIES: radical SAM family heme chaperone HemW [Bacillaceae]MBU9722518.1 radical SAM family heme chaperone HemW [Bacillus alkalicola]